MTNNGHHNVSSLVSDLVEMAQATKRLPELERELEEAKRIMARDGDTIARLERKLQDRAGEIDNLKAQLRSAEVERDDAGFRQLEAEDKHNGLRDAIEAALVSMGGALAVTTGDGKDTPLRMTKDEIAEWKAWQMQKEFEAKAEEAAKAIAEPPKPAEFIMPEAAVAAEPAVVLATIPGDTLMYDEPKGQSASHPTTTDAVGGLTALATAPSEPVASQTSASSTEGQSEPLPTDASLTEAQSVPLVSVPKSDTVSETEQRPEGKYSGKLYRSWPVFVSEADWCVGGGTHESYWEGREKYRAAL